MKHFLKYFFGFHFVSILGVLVGFILYNIQSVTNPLSSFLQAETLYIVGFFSVAALHFILWIFVDKATTYNLKGRILSFIGDYFFLIAAILSTVGSLFLLHTFIL